MSTSLSRQLNQLRTSQQHKDVDQPFGPSVIGVSIGTEELTTLSKEAFHELTISCPVLKDYHGILFPDESEEESMDTSDKSVEDILFFLSSRISQPSAQYVLQYLITKHQVHTKFTETLLFAVIPHFEKTIFHRVVEALPTSQTQNEDYPKWVENFKMACHPATKVGMTRHLASDDGFFKLFCSIYVQKLFKGHIRR